MKILNQPVSSMYLWTIALLSILVIISSYTLHTFPFPLVFAVILASIVEILIRKLYLKHRFKFPFSGIITGLIIGSVAPINSSLILIIITVVIAILSKFLLQYKSSNIFNPASLGLIVGLAIFGVGDVWWAASSYNIYGIAMTLTPILVILAYQAKRLPTAFSFVIATIVLDLASGGLSTIALTSFVALLFSINYYFAFVMLVEPKTSPYKWYAQIVYGAAIAGLYFGLAFFRMPYSILIALLIGNFFYMVYRKLGKR